jgi:hypothetical protein
MTRNPKHALRRAVADLEDVAHRDGTGGPPTDAERGVSAKFVTFENPPEGKDEDGVGATFIVVDQETDPQEIGL